MTATNAEQTSAATAPLTQESAKDIANSLWGIELGYIDSHLLRQLGTALKTAAQTLADSPDATDSAKRFKAAYAALVEAQNEGRPSIEIGRLLKHVRGLAHACGVKL